MGEIVRADESFETFWKIYPRRVARKDALKAWMQTSLENRVLALAAISVHVKAWKVNGTGKEFLPYPASWIRGERFNDELDMPPEMPQCDWNRGGTREVGAGRCAEQAVKEADGQFYCSFHCQRLGLRVVRG